MRERRAVVTTNNVLRLQLGYCIVRSSNAIVRIEEVRGLQGVKGLSCHFWNHRREKDIWY